MLCASLCCANGMQLFFISHLARWLRTRRFSEPTFRPSGATHHWKNRVNRDFSTLSRTCIVCLLSLSLLCSSLLFSSHLLFSSLTLPTSAFSSVHTVGSLTSMIWRNLADQMIKHRQHMPIFILKEQPEGEEHEEDEPSPAAAKKGSQVTPGLCRCRA